LRNLPKAKGSRKRGSPKNSGKRSRGRSEVDRVIMMTKKRLEHFKSLLDRTMVELLDEANKTVNDMTTHTETCLTQRTGRAWNRTGISLSASRQGEKADRKNQRGSGKNRDRHLRHLRVLREEISEERLEARPVTTLCIECKTKQEQEEKVRGQ